MKALEYACLIELRLDYFLTRDYASLKQLRNAFSIPMIFSLRSKLHGGNDSQPEENRLAEI
ncbi:MAG TPA: type I 3-dehydroquinate dehydratase, partial [Waddliaceae bacterium]